MPYVKAATQRKPTRHLFITLAVGPATQAPVTAHVVAAALQQFCGGTAGGDGCSSPRRLHVTAVDDTQGHCWRASFIGPDAVAAAVAARQALSSGSLAPQLLGREVTAAKFSKWLPDADSTEQELRDLLDEPPQPPQPPPVLRSTEAASIPGLSLIPDFVCPEQEARLLAAVDAAPWLRLSKRRVQHYGFEFKYSQRGVDLQQRVGQIPGWAAGLAARMEALPGVQQRLDQLTVNEYVPGVGIAPHVDAHSSFTGAVLALSLAGGAVMVFRRGYTPSTNPDRIHLPHVQASLAHQRQRQQQQQQDGQQQQQQEQPEVQLYLPPRSLLVIAGEARYGWQHYIPHRKCDVVDGCQLPRAARRVSLTFRQVRGRPCHCKYPECCDSQDGVLPPPRLAALEDEQQQQQQPDEQQQIQQQQQYTACNGHAAVRHHVNGAANGAAPNAAAASAPAQPQPQPQPPQPQQLPPPNPAASPPPPASPPAAAAAQAAAVQLEAVHVHQVYDAIAPHFSSTRFAVWPKVRAFLEGLPPGAVLADVGCGNGKYLGVRRDVAPLACDRSQGLAAVAAQRLTSSSLSGAAPAAPGADVLVCDALALPYRRGSCDAALCIAVLHHISSRARRVHVLRQLAAVLRRGGRCLVTVWATDQEDPAKTIHRWHPIQQQQQQEEEHEEQEGQQQQQQQQQEQQQQQGQDYLVPWHLPYHRAGALQAAGKLKAAAAAAGSRNGGDGGDGGGDSTSSSSGSGSVVAAAAGVAGLRLDDSKGAVVLQRFYHLFEPGELQVLVAEVPGLRVVDAFYDRSNWCVVCAREAGD